MSKTKEMEDDDALHNAAQGGYTEIVNWAALHHASWAGHTKVVERYSMEAQIHPKPIELDRRHYIKLRGVDIWRSLHYC